MNDKICPRCKTQNPPTVERCHNCYAVMLGVKPKKSNSEEARIGSCVVLTGLALLTLGGWLPRRGRWITLSAGLSAIVGALRWNDVKNLSSKIVGGSAKKDEVRAVGVANTILMNAISAKATAIRFDKNANSVRVKFEVNAEWREQLELPLEDWVAVREHFKSRAQVSHIIGQDLGHPNIGQDAGKFSELENGRYYEIHVDYQAHYPQETVVMEL